MKKNTRERIVMGERWMEEIAWRSYFSFLLAYSVYFIWAQMIEHTMEREIELTWYEETEQKCQKIAM